MDKKNLYSKISILLVPLLIICIASPKIPAASVIKSLAAGSNTVSAKKTTISAGKSNIIKVSKSAKSTKIKVSVTGTAKNHVTVKYGKTTLFKGGKTKNAGDKKAVANKTSLNLTATASANAINKQYRISITYYKGNKKICTKTTKSVKVKSVPVTSITLSKTSLSIDTGENYGLKAEIKPANASNKTVTWSTSNKNIASVSSTGVVTGVSGGFATITAFAEGKSATCTVKVRSKDIPVTGITLDKTAPSVGDMITATITPQNATNIRYLWYTGDDSGNITTLVSGQKTNKLSVTEEMANMYIKVVAIGDLYSEVSAATTTPVPEPPKPPGIYDAKFGNPTGTIACEDTYIPVDVLDENKDAITDSTIMSNPSEYISVKPEDAQLTSVGNKNLLIVLPGDVYTEATTVTVKVTCLASEKEVETEVTIRDPAAPVKITAYSGKTTGTEGSSTPVLLEKIKVQDQYGREFSTDNSIIAGMFSTEASDGKYRVTAASSAPDSICMGEDDTNAGKTDAVPLDTSLYSISAGTATITLKLEKSNGSSFSEVSGSEFDFEFTASAATSS